MAHLNPNTREVSANIVYYGPSGSGKTASLEFIYRKLRNELRGRLTRIPTQLDPTVTYEVIPVELGEIKGLRTRFQITSVPGDPIHRPTRKMLLRDVDGIVFVADARTEWMEGNFENLKDLEENLAAYGRDLADVPLVFQWNRSDAPDALTSEALDRRLGRPGAQAFRTVAQDGTGVLHALTTIAKQILRKLRADFSSPTEADATPGIEPAARRSATFRVAEPPPAVFSEPESRSGREERFDPRSISHEHEEEPSLAKPEAAERLQAEQATPATDGLGATLVVDSFDEVVQDGDLIEADAEIIGEEELPEARVEDLAVGEVEAGAVGEVEVPLDIPMEPFSEAAEGSPAPDALESAFEPLDFTGEVTQLATQGGMEAEEEAWEIISAGNPTRLGPTSFTIPLEIREGALPPRSVEITITLTPARVKREPS
jgi:GTPase SAR1 family protein